MNIVSHQIIETLGLSWRNSGEARLRRGGRLDEDGMVEARCSAKPAKHIFKSIIAQVVQFL